MAFCTLDNQYLKEKYTPIDNVFILEYLPKADATDIKVYLYGLTLASSPDNKQNTITQMAITLKLSEERVISAFKYWEQNGLISISATLPVRITYYPVKKPLPPIIKYNKKQYSTFVEEATRLFPERILSPNELTEFIELIRVYKIENNSMIMIIKYCLDFKSGTASTPYILAVANDWIKKGLTTEEEVNEHISNLEANSTAIRMIFKSLGLRRDANLDDRQLFLKWTIEYNYCLDAILTASKALKRKGGMQRLDRYIEELKNADAFSAEEIATYTKNKQEIYDLAINIVKNIGGFYASMDIVIETYVLPWLQKGFTNDALLTIARFCFLKNVRTLDGMQQMVDRFFKLGLVNIDGINNYIDKQITIDQEITKIFEKCNHMGIVTNRDRQYYKTWIEWGFDDQLIDFVASMAKNNPFPMQNINRNLAILHQKQISQIDDAKAELQQQRPYEKKTETKKEPTYTDEQLKKVLVDFGEWEI